MLYAVAIIVGAAAVLFTMPGLRDTIGGPANVPPALDSPVASPTVEPSVTPGASPTDDASPAATATPDGSPTSDVSPAATTTPDVSATAEPSPSPEPSPTASPDPSPDVSDEHRLTVPGLSMQGIAEPPPPPPIDPGFLALESRLRGIIQSDTVGGRFAIAVTDLQTGHMIGVNQFRPQLSGCVMNLYVLIEVARQLQSGELALGQVNELVYATTWSSNAVTAEALYRIAGGGDVLAGVRKVAALHDLLRLSDATIIDHPPLFAHESLGIDFNNWMSAADANLTLEALYHGRLLDAPRTAYLLDAMATVKPGLNYLTAAMVPGDVIVHHKNGFFPADNGFVDNDAGIVRFFRGGREYAYAVTFLSEATPEKYSELPLAWELMYATWLYFDARYP